ncbi:MAG: hydrogenase nickel incorporation protein HypB [Desulfobacterales bacterium]|nr:hydrogenase nickel incorporation protein HypB [Desulfobacterales bacterium]
MEVKVLRKVLDVNDTIAEQNRHYFEKKGVFVLNVMSAPGAGKTTILEKTLTSLMPKIKCAVIVGDICTTNDADRLSKSGVPVIQINTDQFGGDCHLAAHVIQRAASEIQLDGIDLLIIENIGNLVCPAEFDIGEHKRVVVLSVTEGEDKPVKYPLMFRVCHTALINKIDLLPYLDADIQLLRNNIAQINPEINQIELSAKTGIGFKEWITWIEDQIKLYQKTRNCA